RRAPAKALESNRDAIVSEIASAKRLIGECIRRADAAAGSARGELDFDRIVDGFRELSACCALHGDDEEPAPLELLLAIGKVGDETKLTHRATRVMERLKRPNFCAVDGFV